MKDNEELINPETLIVKQFLTKHLANYIAGSYGTDLEALHDAIMLLLADENISKNFQRYYKEKSESRIRYLNQIGKELATIKSYYETLEEQEVLKKDQTSQRFINFQQALKNLKPTILPLYKDYLILIRGTTLKDHTATSTSIAEARNLHKKFMTKEEKSLQIWERKKLKEQKIKEGRWREEDDY